MTIKQQGGIFGRKPTFSEVTSDTVTADTVNADDVKMYSGTTLIGSISSAPNSSINIDGGGTTNNTGWAFSNPGVLPRFAGALQDNRNDLGSNAYRMDDIYATNTTIQTSDANEKQDVAQLTDAELRVATACKSLVRKYRWIHSVEEKGDAARTHVGIIAQDLQAAFAAEGLDAGDYGMFIHTTWTDDETGEERNRMGIRYSELFAFIIAAL